MKNKLEKFLTILSSFFLMALIVMGMKIESDEEKLNKLKKELEADPRGSGDISEAQKGIALGREKILSEAAHSPAEDVLKTTTTKTVIPQKTTEKTTSAADSTSSSSKKSSKKTRSS